ncbi:MAG: tetratricopeptide repeat protein [Planctomycetia bacterium]
MAPSAVPAASSTATAPRETGIDRWRDLLFQSAIIVLAGLWIYSPAYHGDWLWDDDQLLTANPVVQSGSLAGLAKLWFNPDGADFFPLSYTALWAQWPFFGNQPTGYHVTTILLHITAALLLWALLARMRIPGAWLSGLLFAIHPVCVESVAWVSETKNTLSLPLFLLCCLCWVVQDEEPDARRRARFYALSIVLFLLAMLAKTSMVALPVVLLVYAWWKRGTVSFDDAVRVAPFFLISLVLGIITCSDQWGRAIGAEKIPVGGVASRIATAGMAILFYLGQIVWPVNLLPIYPRWEVDPPKAWQFLAWPVIGGAAAWIWASRGTAERPGWGRHAAFGLGFFLLMVLPVLGFVTISYKRITWVADHFIYLPMIGVIPLVGAALTRWYERAEESSRSLIMAGGAIALATCMLLSFRYANAWAGEDALWTHTLKTNHDAWQAHNRLGAKKFARGDIESAYYHFTQSTKLRPDLGETHNNLGSALMAKGRLDEAIKEFTEACRRTPQVPQMQVNLANALFQAGRFSEAADRFRALLEKEPNNPALLNNYAVTLYRQGNRGEAAQMFRRALEINPGLKDARDGQAVALGERPDPAAGRQPETPPPPPRQEPAPPGQSTLGPTSAPAPVGKSFDPLGIQGK